MFACPVVLSNLCKRSDRVFINPVPFLGAKGRVGLWEPFVPDSVLLVVSTGLCNFQTRLLIQMVYHKPSFKPV